MNIQSASNSEDAKAKAKAAKEAIEKIVQVGMRQFVGGHQEAAENTFRFCLQMDPNQAKSMHYLGMLLVMKGQIDDGLDLIRRSIKIDPSDGVWHNSLGHVLLEHGYAVSSKTYEKEAEDAFLKAISRRQDFAEAHTNLANLYSYRGDMRRALIHFKRVVHLQPTNNNARSSLAAAYVRAGQEKQATELYKEWLLQEPDNAMVKHLLSALTGEKVPARAEDGYVVSVFDGCADTFDEHLSKLEYKAPQLVADATRQLLGEPACTFDVLDAGCGTGLCVGGMRPFARRLVGIDLSPKMIEKARQRGGYDELATGELVEFLMGRPCAFDLVVSADTLCYFGRLDDALRGCFVSLRPQGGLVFTVEAMDVDGDYKLCSQGRYEHGRGYVERTLADAGFAQIALCAVVLRMEYRRPVNGWLVSARRPAHESDSSVNA